MKQIYLLTTDHLEDRLWFREEEDFKVAMNYVAIEAARRPSARVLAFILMSNHVHFVLSGERGEVRAFVVQFRQRYSLYYSRKYDAKEFLRRNGIDIKLIPEEDEAPEKAIAYVQMNCVAANICAHPSQYPWGTGSIFFNSVHGGSRRLKDLSARARKRLLHTDADDLPGAWHLSENGYILPEAYVNVREVEALFRTPRRLNYFLINSSKAKKRMVAADNNLPAFRDQTILAALPDLCHSLFQRDSFRALRREEQAEFARQIRFRFSADASQVARVCGISYAEAALLLDTV